MDGTVNKRLTAAAKRLGQGSALCLCAIALLTGPGCGGGGGGPTTPPTVGPSSSTGPDHFGVDGFSQQHLRTISELGDGASGVNDIRWGSVERNPPVGGQHSYTDPQDAVQSANTLRSLGRQLQVNIRPDNDWALQTGSRTQVDPSTGRRIARWVRIKPEYLNDWADLIRFAVRTVSIDYLQISSEAENSWESPQGFAEAVCVAASAAKSVKPDIKVLASGFNLANYLLIDAERRAQILRTATPAQLQEFYALEEQMQLKMEFISQFLAASRGCFDILTLHLNDLPTASHPTVQWMRAQMATQGYERPIWSDDMASGPSYSELFSTADELAFESLVENENPAALEEYAVEQAKTAVKKPVHAFAAGVQRVFLSTDTDWSTYFIPFWRHQGLLSVEGVRKPAFYSYQQLIAEIDGFVRAEQVYETTFRFSFADKDPVVLVWTEGEARTVDLSGVVPSGTVRVKSIVTRLDRNLQPIRTPDVTVSAGAVPISTTPVVVTRVN